MMMENLNWQILVLMSILELMVLRSHLNFQSDKFCLSDKGISNPFGTHYLHILENVYTCYERCSVGNYWVIAKTEPDTSAGTPCTCNYIRLILHSVTLNWYLLSSLSMNQFEFAPRLMSKKLFHSFVKKSSFFIGRPILLPPSISATFVETVTGFSSKYSFSTSHKFEWSSLHR